MDQEETSRLLEIKLTTCSISRVHVRRPWTWGCVTTSVKHDGRACALELKCLLPIESKWQYELGQIQCMSLNLSISICEMGIPQHFLGELL